MLFHSAPLVHVITNSVTINETVNAILASGARAVCADSPDEAEQITSLSDALVINIGMPSAEKLEAMVRSGRRANQMGIPVVLDPVGAAASSFRERIIQRLLEEIRFAAIRGNQSEIAALCRVSFRSAGVEDAGVMADDTQMMQLSDETGAVIAATGEIDRAAFGGRVERIQGGTPLQKKITGCGCMLSGLLGAALADERKTAAQKNLSVSDADFDSVVNTLRLYKEAAEAAGLEMRRNGGMGTMSFVRALIDRISRLGRPEWSRSCLKLYAVTDRTWLNGRSLYDVVEQSLRGGVTMVQLREKNLDDAAFTDEARRLLPLCRRYQVPLIINDRVSVCLDAGADGVHLGQDDLSVAEARRLLGPDAIIGATAHCAEEALEAQRQGADYLGVGAAFGSQTKRDAKPIDRGEYRRITAAVKIPVAAIGGINQDNIMQLCGAGLAGVAVISAIYASGSIEEAAARLLELSRRL